MDRRNFIKGAAAGGIAALGVSAFAAPKNPLAGINVIQYARGNVVSKAGMIDACSALPLTEKDVEDFMKATATYGVQANMFAPLASILGDDFTGLDAAGLNLRSFKFSEKFKNARFAGAISIRDLDEAQMEIARCADMYKFSAVVFPDFDKIGSVIWDDKNLPLFKTAAAKGLPVIVSYSADDAANLDSQICKLIEKISAAGLSSLKLVLPAYGGAFTWINARRGKSLPANHPFYFFAGDEISSEAFQCFKSVFGSNRLIFGSCGRMDYAQVIKNMETLPLDAADFRKTCFGNANTLFGFNIKQ